MTIRILGSMLLALGEEIAWRGLLVPQLAIERAALPSGITFQFTKGRTVFAGSDEPNLQGKGVTLDVRVSITAENEQARLDGRDPVLEAALALLAEEHAAQMTPPLTAVSWQRVATLDAGSQVIPVADPADYQLSFGADGAQQVTADCNQAGGTYTLGDAQALTFTLGPVTTAACAADSRGDELLFEPVQE